MNRRRRRIARRRRRLRRLLALATRCAYAALRSQLDAIPSMLKLEPYLRSRGMRLDADGMLHVTLTVHPYTREEADRLLAAGWREANS